MLRMARIGRGLTGLLFVFVLAALVIGFYAYGMGGSGAVVEATTSAAAGDGDDSSGNDGVDAGEWDWRELGQAVFMKQCAACHGPDGDGMPGVFPAFVDNPFVMGDPKTVIRVPMNGRGGMPTFRTVLSDEELAAVLSHIRNSWGNEADPITPDLVAEVRAEE